QASPFSTLAYFVLQQYSSTDELSWGLLCPRGRRGMEFRRIAALALVGLLAAT
ncbi:unnamed protein product, partial [Ectocarpus sp. 12 AP-2014]